MGNPHPKIKIPIKILIVNYGKPEEKGLGIMQFICDAKAQFTALAEETD